MQAAQNAQRDSQELFQAMFFRDHEDDSGVCMTDAVIYQLRANGVMVYVPKWVSHALIYAKDLKLISHITMDVMEKISVFSKKLKIKIKGLNLIMTKKKKRNKTLKLRIC